jgi:hypothetical protein
VVQWTEERGDAAARERLAATVPGLVTLLKELETPSAGGCLAFHCLSVTVGVTLLKELKTPSADTPCTAEAQEVTARALFQLARR